MDCYEASGVSLQNIFCEYHTFARLPDSKHWRMKFISKILMKLLGWKVIGGVPPDIRKCVLIAVPHTSNWDFLYGRQTLYIFGVKLKYLIKKELFFFPLNLLFMATGGIAVDRKKSYNIVNNMIELFDKYDTLFLMFAPEGTRSRVEKWKTGFYHVAIGAKVPILMGYIDYEKKITGVGPAFYPSGDVKKDFEFMEDFYKKFTPRKPENYNPEIFIREEMPAA